MLANLSAYEILVVVVLFAIPLFIALLVRVHRRRGSARARGPDDSR